MKFRTDLRYRVALAFALLGAFVSTGVAGVFYLLTLNMEQRLITQTLNAELDNYVARYRRDPSTPPPAGGGMQMHVVGAAAGDMPRELAGLAGGLHRLRIGDRHYYVAVREQDGRRFLLTYDDALIRHREQQFRLFFLIGVVIMTLLSALLGAWLAGRVVAPVAELARRVAGLRPEDRPAPLADSFPHDEVGELAQDFDAYLQRLGAFMERERAFTSDVSHELRTPLTVIRGATEVLLADTGLEPALRRRLERIARSAQEISELIEALLLLAREEQGRGVEASCEVEAVLRQVLDSHAHLLAHKPVDVRFEVDAPLRIAAQCTLLRVVLANLVRNAFSFTREGEVRVRLCRDGVTVEDTGSGIAEEDLQRVFDHFYRGEEGGAGIGLSLVRRICDRHGWTLELDSEEGRGTRVRLLFDHPERADDTA